MPATYLGQTEVGEAASGLLGAYSALRDAMADLRSASAAAAAAMAAAAACFSAQLSALAAAQVDISAQALPAPSAQVAGSAEAVIQIGQALLDPVGYFQGLLAGLVNVQGSITADLASPVLPLLAQLDAAASVSVSLDLGLSALTASIGALAAIELAGSECALALLAAAAALGVALQSAQDALSAAQAVLGSAGTAGGYALVYSGALSGAGAALDSVTPSSGVGPAVPVRMVVSFVLQSDGPAMSAQASLMKVS